MWKKVFYAVSVASGVALFIFVIAQFGGIAKTLEVVGKLGGVGLAAYLAVFSLTQVAPAIGWTMLMRGEGLQVPVGTALKANFMGFPLNFIAPTMYLGSEPLKLIYVAQTHGEQKRRVLATIIVNKFQEIGALLFVMIVSAAVSVWRIELTRRDEILLILAMALLAAIFGVSLFAFAGNLKPTVKVIHVLARVKRWRRPLARLRTRAEEMEIIIHAAFVKRWKLFLASQAVTLVSALAILMRPWIYFYFSEGRMVPTEHLCAIYLVTNFINSLPHTPGGLGILEGGMVAIFALLGLGKENAAAFSVIGRAADLVLILVGTWLIVHYGMQAIARRVAQGKEKVTSKEIGSLSEQAIESWPPPRLRDPKGQ